MSSRAVILGVAFILTSLPMAALAHGGRTGDDVAIHVLTMGPDRFLVTRFGHTAILVADRDTGEGTVYNFGEFDYRDPALIGKFITGRLQYYLDITTKEKLLRFYRRVGRGMTSQELSLDKEQKRRLIRRLALLSAPENRAYTYRHFENNCCTIVRDLIDDVTDGALSRNSPPARQTRRFLLSQSLAPLPLARAGLMFLLGPAADRPISDFEAQFFPQVLSDSLDTARHLEDHRPLVIARSVLSHANPSRVRPTGAAFQTAVLFGLPALVLLGFILAALRPGHRFALRVLGVCLVLWGLTAGIGGAVLLFLWAFTEHLPAHANENLLVFPVTHLALAVVGGALFIRARLAMRMRRALLWILGVSIGGIVLDLILKLGPFIQVNGTFVTAALSMNAAAVWAVLVNRERTSLGISSAPVV